MREHELDVFESDEQPMMRCPRCGAEHPDFDGFGFVAHTKPAFADGCGYCSHPARLAATDGTSVCEICAEVRQEGE
jgi:hypothetical protein